MTTLEKIREGIDTRFKEARLENTRFYYDVLDIIDKYAEEPMKESLNGVFLELSELGIQDIVCAEEIYRLIHITYEIGFNTGFNEAKAEQEPCDDAISRQAVLEIAKQHTLTNDYLAIQELPPVRPQEPNSDIRLNRVKNELNQVKNELKSKTGHWKFVCQHWRKCSECGFSHKFAEDWKYCPNCGCAMKGE